MCPPEDYNKEGLEGGRVLSSSNFLDLTLKNLANGFFKCSLSDPDSSSELLQKSNALPLINLLNNLGKTASYEINLTSYKLFQDHFNKFSDFPSFARLNFLFEFLLKMEAKLNKYLPYYTYLTTRFKLLHSYVVTNKITDLHT